MLGKIALFPKDILPKECIDSKAGLQVRKRIIDTILGFMSLALKTFLHDDCVDSKADFQAHKIWKLPSWKLNSLIFLGEEILNPPYVRGEDTAQIYAPHKTLESSHIDD